MDLLVVASGAWGGVVDASKAAKRNAGRAVTVAGLTFPNPVGLAASFDKDARWLPALEMLGFGFVEIGADTPGHKVAIRSRGCSLKEDRGILNRMGFNNEGLYPAVGPLVRRPEGLVVGGNIGKNKVTPNDRAEEDYLACVDALHAHVDYFVVNVSSPNTPGLRELQEKEPLSKLLRAVVSSRSHAGHRPVFLKIAPDLTDGQLDDIVDIVLEENVDGVVAKTPPFHARLKTSQQEVERMGAGGISGVPLQSQSTEVAVLAEKSHGRFPIIGVGGIDGAESAREKMEAGASLVQVYSGMIYEGPGLPSRIVEGL